VDGAGGRPGRNWARILSTVLVGLATLGLSGDHGVAQVFCAWLTWLTGLAAVVAALAPASSAFFKPHALTGKQPWRARPDRRARQGWETRRVGGDVALDEGRGRADAAGIVILPHSNVT